MNRHFSRVLLYLHRLTNYNKSSVSITKNPLLGVQEYRNLAFQRYNQIKFRFSVRIIQYLQTRNNSSDSENPDNKRKPPSLMNFLPVMRPEIIRSVKNWILARFIIQPYLDVEFTLRDFTHGAKQALEVVSHFLSQGDFQSLEGLVADDAIREIKRNFSALNMKERQELLIKLADIIFAFPYQIGIIFDDDNQKRFAEITVVYHCLEDLENIKAQNKMLSQEVAGDIKICNYRFIREYTKGVKSDWTINKLGHFKVRDFQN